jgi:preprotein translocase subunit SecE
MAVVTEDSSAGGSFWTELFSGRITKARQGRIVRQLTALAIWVVVWLGSWQLFETLRSGVLPGLRESAFGQYVIFGAPTMTALVGMWIGFRLVCWPRFASFLIDVEAELSKVSWPSKTELYKAAGVVIFVMVFIALILFCFDMLWQAIFDWLRVS